MNQAMNQAKSSLQNSIHRHLTYSLATLGLPGFGYGIHYEYGLFRQEIDNGYQRERPENWLSEAGLIAIERDDESCIIPVYGHIEHERDLEGNYNPMWMGWQMIIGVPLDIPIVGYGGQTVNYLRLFEARPSSEFDIQILNEGDYFRAMEQKISSENISKILYPSDLIEPGRELRLLQEYFLVACAALLWWHRHLAGAMHRLEACVTRGSGPDNRPALSLFAPSGVPARYFFPPSARPGYYNLKHFPAPIKAVNPRPVPGRPFILA